MCLITKQKKAKIAKEDIICYKLITKSNNKLTSYHYSFEYSINELYTTEFSIIKGKDIKIRENTLYADSKAAFYYINQEKGGFKGFICIQKGFHSFKTNEINSIRESNYKCIIPKGSEYYEDATGLIVSNQIIIKEKL